MAWPLTPLTTYLAGGSPAIKAFDLNAIQAAINSIVGGVLSLKALVLDGTGGLAVAPRDGTGVCTGTVSSTTFPSPLSYPAGGVLARGTLPIGWAVVASTGVLLNGFNVLSGPGVVRTGAGVYEITFNAEPSTASVCAIVTPTTFSLLFQAEPSLVGAKLKIKVSIWAPVAPPVPSPTDCGFSLLVFGE